MGQAGGKGTSYMLSLVNTCSRDNMVNSRERGSEEWEHNGDQDSLVNRGELQGPAGRRGPGEV